MNPRWLIALFGVATLSVVVGSFHDLLAAAPRIVVRSAGPIPNQILAGGKNILISRVGRDFYKRHLTLNLARCAHWTVDDSATDGRGLPGKQHPPPESQNGFTAARESLATKLSALPRWGLSYDLTVISKPWVQGTVFVSMDSLGAACGPVPVYGVSDCVRHPEECTFSVTKERARRIAKSAGLSKGIAPWRVSFQWDRYAKVPCYVWMVSSTLSADSNGYPTHSETKLISASTGRVLTTDRN